jgi:hypothetical protein
MNKILGSLVIACSALGLASAAVAGEKWIHIRVDDAGRANARVDIQVPVVLLSALLPAFKGTHGVHAVHMNGDNVDTAELRSYWNAVRDAKDGQYVTVRDAGSDVRISKSGGFLKLLVDDQGGVRRVRMKIPVPLVDAVLAGGDTIDVDSIGAAIEKDPLGDLLTVDDDDSHVRIWIDTGASPSREDER